MNLRKNLSIGVALVMAWLLGSCGPREAPKPRQTATAKYLEGAEIQAETDAQRAVLAQALEDMATLQAEGLRGKRYGPDQKPLAALLRAHLVPAGPVAVEDDQFVTQAGEPEVRAAVEKLRGKLKAGGQ